MMLRNSGGGRGAGGGRGGTGKRPAAGRGRAAPTGDEGTRGRGKGGGRNQKGTGGGGNSDKGGSGGGTAAGRGGGKGGGGSGKGGSGGAAAGRGGAAEVGASVMSPMSPNTRVRAAAAAVSPMSPATRARARALVTSTSLSAVGGGRGTDDRKRTASDQKRTASDRKRPAAVALGTGGGRLIRWPVGIKPGGLPRGRPTRCSMLRTMMMMTSGTTLLMVTSSRGLGRTFCWTRLFEMRSSPGKSLRISMWTSSSVTIRNRSAQEWHRSLRLRTMRWKTGGTAQEAMYIPVQKA